MTTKLKNGKKRKMYKATYAISVNVDELRKKLEYDKIIEPMGAALGGGSGMKPTIMIFPSDGWLMDNGFAKFVDNQGVKTLIQEQNSYPGITNRLLSKSTNSICVAYDELERYFPEDKIEKTGNPIRQNLLSVSSKREEGLRFFELESSKKTLLVIGGSLGAKAINILIASSVYFLKENDVQYNGDDQQDDAQRCWLEVPPLFSAIYFFCERVYQSSQLLVRLGFGNQTHSDCCKEIIVSLIFLFLMIKDNM